MSTSNTLYIPQDFWFTRNPGLALPLVSLQYLSCPTCGSTRWGHSRCYKHNGNMTIKYYMKSRTIRKHRAKFEPVMQAIKRYYPLNLLKRKFNKVLYELQFTPPIKEIFPGGLFYQQSLQSFETQSKNL